VVVREPFRRASRRRYQTCGLAFFAFAFEACTNESAAETDCKSSIPRDRNAKKLQRVVDIGCA